MDEKEAMECDEEGKMSSFQDANNKYFAKKNHKKTKKKRGKRRYVEVFLYFCSRKSVSHKTHK